MSQFKKPTLLAGFIGLVSCSKHSASLKTEAIYSSEMSVDFHWTLLENVIFHETSVRTLL